MRYYIGLDLGKLRSNTAVCVVERKESLVGRDPVTLEVLVERRLRVKYAERLALGTGYLEAAGAVVELAGRMGNRGETVVAADASGVGEAVVEVLRREMGPAAVKALRIKGAGQAMERGAATAVARGELVEALALEMERGTVGWKGMEGDRQRLEEELAGLAREKRRNGAGDDLALALALAVWEARKGWVGWKGRGPYVRGAKTVEDAVREWEVRKGPVGWWLRGGE